MQSKWDAMKERAVPFLIAVCLLAAGLGGYVLLRPDTAPVPTEDTPPAETTVSAPVTTIREETAKPAPTPAPAPQDVQMKEVSAPVFIPDDTPVIAAPPRVVVAPLEGDVVTAFSTDRLVYNETLADWRTHDGVDIAAEMGTEVLSAAAGTVAAVENDPLMGTVITVDHPDGCRTTYANLQESPAVAVGDSVSAGQPIGTVGTSAAEAAQGPHLHFSVSKEGIPLDPAAYLE